MPKQDLDWTTRPMRWGQINIREVEPPEFDVDWWETYWRRIHLDGITLNAGGVWTYYPTQLEDQHRSRWLGDRDLYKELVDAVKRCRMRILARIDPSLSHPYVYYRHPEWFALDREGHLLREDTHEELYATCMNGAYYREFIPKIIREIHSRYDVDGIFCSEWDGRRRICYCPRCRRLFTSATDHELPARADPADMAWKKWLIWQERRLEDLWRLWDRTTKEMKPGTTFMGNHSDKGHLADYADMINTDHQSRRTHTPLWHVGERGKRMRALTQGKKPYYHIFSTNSYSRHVAKPEAEHRLYIAEAILADSRPWFTIIGGVQADRRQFGPLEAMYRWHYEHEDYLRDRQSLAQVAVAFSDRERFFPPEKGGGDAFRGMYYALLRNRIPFHLVHTGRMDEEVLKPYKLLMLPNTAALSDDEAEEILQFVRKGGSLIATYETGLYDEWGNSRSAGVLDELLGVASRSPSIGPLLHSYSRLHGPHPILAGVEGTEVTLNSEHLVPVVPRQGVDASALTLIPPYPRYPPETAYSRTGDSTLPLVLLTEATEGQGRRVYWPGNVDALFWSTNAPDHGRFLLNSVRWAFGVEQRTQVTGPGLIEMHAYRQKDNLQVHMVNLTNPDVWMAPVHELLPVGRQTIRIRVPDGQELSGEARCLVSERRLEVSQSEGWAETTLPDILDHEIVVFELS